MSRVLASIALAGVLSVPSIPAFADDVLAKAQGIEIDILASSTSMWNGSTLPAYPEGQPEVSVVKITIPEGMALPLHIHPQMTAGVLLEGHLEVQTPEGARRELHAGEALIELVNQPHAGANIGDGPAVILVVYGGIEGQPVTQLLKPSVD